VYVFIFCILQIPTNDDYTLTCLIFCFLLKQFLLLFGHFALNSDISKKHNKVFRYNLTLLLF